MFFDLMWISIIEYGTLLCCVFCTFDFHLSFKSNVWNLFAHPLFCNCNDEKKTSQTEREGWFFWYERVWEREEQCIPLWCLDETFQNSKWESVFCHSFWYPLQTPADHARSAGKKEVADMIDNFQVDVCRFDLRLLLNIFPGLSSKLFLLQFDSFLISKFQGNQRARCCLNGLRFLFLTIYFFIKDEKYCSSLVSSIFIRDSWFSSDQQGKSDGFYFWVKKKNWSKRLHTKKKEACHQQNVEEEEGAQWWSWRKGKKKENSAGECEA